MNPAKIFIIDDERTIRLAFRLALETDGYDVQEAASANEAMMGFKAEKYDLVILDLRIGEDSGLDVLAATRECGVAETLEAAQRMGGMVIVLKRDDVAGALIDFAREYGVTQFVVGRPGKRPLWRRWQLSFQEKLLQELNNVDLVVV